MRSTARRRTGACPRRRSPSGSMCPPRRRMVRSWRRSCLADTRRTACHAHPSRRASALERDRHPRLSSSTSRRRSDQRRGRPRRMPPGSRHALSADLEARIDRALGFPTHAPHGDPIPTQPKRPQTRREALASHRAAIPTAPRAASPTEHGVCDYQDEEPQTALSRRPSPRGASRVYATTPSPFQRGACERPVMNWFKLVPSRSARRAARRHSPRHPQDRRPRGADARLRLVSGVRARRLRRTGGRGTTVEQALQRSTRDPLPKLPPRRPTIHSNRERELGIPASGILLWLGRRISATPPPGAPVAATPAPAGQTRDPHAYNRIIVVIHRGFDGERKRAAAARRRRRVEFG